MSPLKKFAKNTSILFVSQLITYFIAFTYNILTARYLGPNDLGILTFAMALSGVYSVFADLGLSTLTTREVARDRSLSNKYLTNILVIKVFLSILMLFLVSITLFLIESSLEIKIVVYLISFSIIVGNFSLIFSSIYQAHENMEYQSVGQIILSIIIFSGILFVISQGYGLIEFSFVYFIANLVVLCFLSISYLIKYNRPTLDIDIVFWKHILKMGFPLSLTIIFSTISFRIDSIFLSIISGDAAVGLYTVSYRLMESLLFIPNIFAIAILPLFSKFFISSKDSLKVSYSKSFKYLVIISLPIPFGTTILANKLIVFFYGATYLSSTFALQIVIWSIPFLFLTYILKIFLVSINKQNLLLKLMFITVIFNILLNLALIPKLSYLGASIVTVLTEVIFFVFSYYYISKLDFKQSKSVILKPLIGSCIMSIFLIFFNDLNLFINLFIGVLVYILSIILLKTFSSDELIFFKKIIN